MSVAFRHAMIYQAIPSFKCKTGCFDCCGPVVFSEYERSRLTPEQAALVTLDAVVARLRAGQTTCVFASTAGCSIYDKRPYLCRLFGTSAEPKLTCRHGCGSGVKFSREQTAALTNEYEALLRESANVE